jgi:hypothetical protein
MISNISDQLDYLIMQRNEMKRRNHRVEELYYDLIIRRLNHKQEYPKQSHYIIRIHVDSFLDKLSIAFTNDPSLSFLSILIGFKL